MPSKTLNLVNEIVNTATQRGVARIILENTSHDGKIIVIDGQEKISFGSYSYMGLEVDKRLKKSAIDAIERFGIQYPTSRVYTALPMYQKLEELMEQIFGAPVVLTTSLSLGHSGAMAVLVEKEDLVILDQHVHSSVQDAAHKLKASGVKVIVCRHNDLKDLEKKIEEYRSQYRKIWYACDGIYSMYGDVAPIEELMQMLDKHSCFHLYVDDAHGISSFGKNGSGWVLSKVDFHEKMILTSGMAKAFGTMGGIISVKDPVLYERVKNCTGSLIFSGPHPVPILGASVTSAEIHMTEEIAVRQKMLAEKINHCSVLLRRNGLPDISDPETPIFFIAVGVLRAGYTLVKKLLDSDFYVNLASFPAVSESCTGIRFTVTLHHTLEDIERFVNALRIGFLETLKEEELTVNEIRRAFRKVPSFPDTVIEQDDRLVEEKIKIRTYASINELDLNSWKQHFDGQLSIDIEQFERIENVFSENIDPVNNWKFYYLEATYGDDQVIARTFVTEAIIKDDLLADKDISVKIEKEREDSAEFLSSKSLILGTLITEGNHFYVDRSKRNWQKGVLQILKKIEEIRDEQQLNQVLLRDFHYDDDELIDVFRNEGYLKIELPSSHFISPSGWISVDEYLAGLSKRHRKYVRQRALELESTFAVELFTEPNVSELQAFYELYQNVNSNSYEINTFDLPWNLFQAISEDPMNWELIQLNKEDRVVASMLCYNGSKHYNAFLVGLDYDFIQDDIYSQIIWQTVKRANSVKKQLNLGYTASQNKRKFGAQIQQTCAMVKTLDNYHLMQVNSFE